MLSFACVTGRSELNKFRQGPTAIREIRAFPRSFVQHTNERLKILGVDTVKIDTPKKSASRQI